MAKQIVEHPSSDSIAKLAPILGATSDGRVTAESARGLTLTVLGEFVRQTGGAVWTQTMIEVMGVLGVRDKTTRQVLSRLAERGWLERTRHGRRTSWALTTTSARLLDDGAARIYGFGNQRTVWDGTWLVLLVSLGEGERNQRYALTSRLNWSGFGALGQGVWISPWVDLQNQAVQTLGDLGVEDATSFVAEVGSLGSGTALAERAWDLDATRSHYEHFLDFADSLDPAAGGIEAVAQLASLVHRWRRFPFLDPELPNELLPADWPAPEALDRFGELRGRLTEAAMLWWENENTRYQPTVT